MAETSVVITITAGGITFVNQWYQTKRIDWKVPVATLILAGGIDLLAKLDSKGATILAFLILLGAASTKFNGKSAVDTVTALINSKQQPQQKAKK
jgi:hypothetical protein